MQPKLNKPKILKMQTGREILGYRLNPELPITKVAAFKRYAKSILRGEFKQPTDSEFQSFLSNFEDFRDSGNNAKKGNESNSVDDYQANSSSSSGSSQVERIKLSFKGKTKSVKVGIDRIFVCATRKNEEDESRTSDPISDTHDCLLFDNNTKRIMLRRKSHYPRSKSFNRLYSGISNKNQTSADLSSREILRKELGSYSLISGEDSKIGFHREILFISKLSNNDLHRLIIKEALKTAQICSKSQPFGRRKSDHLNEFPKNYIFNQDAFQIDEEQLYIAIVKRSIIFDKNHKIPLLQDNPFRVPWFLKKAHKQRRLDLFRGLILKLASKKQIVNGKYLLNASSPLNNESTIRKYARIASLKEPVSRTRVRKRLISTQEDVEDALDEDAFVQLFQIGVDIENSFHDRRRSLLSSSQNKNEIIASSTIRILRTERRKRSIIQASQIQSMRNFKKTISFTLKILETLQLTQSVLLENELIKKDMEFLNELSTTNSKLHIKEILEEKEKMKARETYLRSLLEIYLEIINIGVPTEHMIIQDDISFDIFERIRVLNDQEGNTSAVKFLDERRFNLMGDLISISNQLHGDAFERFSGSLDDLSNIDLGGYEFRSSIFRFLIVVQEQLKEEKDNPEREESNLKLSKSVKGRFRISNNMKPRTKFVMDPLVSYRAYGIKRDMTSTNFNSLIEPLTTPAKEKNNSFSNCKIAKNNFIKRLTKKSIRHRMPEGFELPYNSVIKHNAGSSTLSSKIRLRQLSLKLP